MATLSLVGYTQDDVASGTLNSQKLTPPAWIAREKEAKDAINASGVCLPFEKVHLRRDGSRVPVQVASAAVHNKNATLPAPPA